MIKKQFRCTVVAFLMLNLFYPFILSAQNVDKAYQHFTAKQYKEAAAEFEAAIPVIQEQKGEKDTSLYSKVLLHCL